MSWEQPDVVETPVPIVWHPKHEEIILAVLVAKISIDKKISEWGTSNSLTCKRLYEAKSFLRFLEMIICDQETELTKKDQAIFAVVSRYYTKWPTMLESIRTRSIRNRTKEQRENARNLTKRTKRDLGNVIKLVRQFIAEEAKSAKILRELGIIDSNPNESEPPKSE